MDTYEQKAYEEVQVWLRKLQKPSSMPQTLTKNVQTRMNQFVPKKFHTMMGQAVKQMVEGVLSGSQYLPNKKEQPAQTLKEADERMEALISVFQKGAAAEGAGTGAGGLFLGAADFPLLLGFKMRFLFTASQIYGLDIYDFRDRLYMLHIFQAAFSSPAKKQETAKRLENWEEYIQNKPRKLSMAKEMDWTSFQQEYRDHIDLVKLLQLMPGFGAVIGAAANYHLLAQLGYAAKEGYRLKWFYMKEKQEN
ncbi:EcsC protein family protein [Alteribacillus persepolensis]|uniref:EcsC protein family protein n=1 Tax=Alteribacillus persepolensis TaxID=568899 RepID=A0A1G8DEV8_9BACI|nr:EcsC family protein [Alteribacillus persepolensis]SDH56228.1 EcsC protein family protein [Alteribacillus persepolensis]